MFQPECCRAAAVCQLSRHKRNMSPDTVLTVLQDQGRVCPKRAQSRRNAVATSVWALPRLLTQTGQKRKTSAQTRFSMAVKTSMSSTCSLPRVTPYALPGWQTWTFTKSSSTHLSSIATASRSKRPIRPAQARRRGCQCHARNLSWRCRL